MLLQVRQVVIVMALGVILWLAAALLLGVLAPTGVHEGASRVILYILVVPGTLPFLLLMERMAGLRRGQVLPGVGVGLMAATLLDGLALAWIPGLYGTEVAHVAGAGSVILWGAGVFLALALVRDGVGNRP